MPQYEYICEEDGEVMTLLRAMKDADAPVDDPKGRGRRFVRRHSTFMTGSSKKTSPSFNGSAGCPCGDPNGPCING